MFEKFKKYKFAFFVSGVILLNIVIMFMGRQLSNHDSEQLLDYNQKIHEFSVTDIDGKKISIDDSGNIWKVLYFTSLNKDDEIRRVRFLNIIRQKIDEPNLMVIGVFRVFKQHLFDFRDQMNLSIPVVCLFENSGIKELLPSSRESSTLVILDPMNRVKFISKFFLENDIKQLLEKFVYGKITYAPMETSKAALVGSMFPIMKVKNLKNGDFEDFPPPRNIVAVIITARCPTCALSKFKSSYTALENFFSMRKIEMSYLFSSRFLESEILETLKDSNVTRYFALDSIPLVENLVVTTPYILDACTCYRSDGKPKCSGDCCGGKTSCDCYDIGADNCTAVVPEV